MHAALDGGAQSLAHVLLSPPLHSHCDVQSLQPAQPSAALQPAGSTGGVSSTGGGLLQELRHWS